MKIYKVFLSSIMLLPTLCYGLKCWECNKGLHCGEDNKPVKVDCKNLYERDAVQYCYENTYTSADGKTVHEKLCMLPEEAANFTEFFPDGVFRLGCKETTGENTGKLCFCDKEYCNDGVPRTISRSANAKRESSSLSLKAWSWFVTGFMALLCQMAR